MSNFGTEDILGYIQAKNRPLQYFSRGHSDSMVSQLLELDCLEIHELSEGAGVIAINAAIEINIYGRINCSRFKDLE
jgi:hypothetical protein